MTQRYDIAIIGSGPAGLSAALNAQIRKKTCILFGNQELSKKLVKAHQINNYLGFPKISGPDLQKQFMEHLTDMEISITEEKINTIYSMGDYFALAGAQVQYEASTVILATGVNYGTLLEGEERLLGKGVGYCATCDAPLYKDKTVAIIGYSKRDEEEADFLHSIASKVYYIPMYQEAVDVEAGIEVIQKKPQRIEGEVQVSHVVVEGQEIAVDGVFILRESSSPMQLVPGLEVEQNHIKVNREMATNIAGCFAAGDIVGKPYQYIKSAGEGNIAALSAVSYLDQKKRAQRSE